MSEVKVYAVALIALMTGAYLTWTAEKDQASTDEVTIVDAKVEQLERVEFYTKTQTIAVGFKDISGERTPWFEVDARGKKKAFVGNSKSKELLEGFAPFVALRTLGKGLSKEEIATTELEKPERKLVLAIGGKERTFEVGGRTSGARDHYVRAQGGDEVYLVGSKVLGDLEYPEGKYMQRKLRDEEKKDVDKVVVAAGDKTITAYQKNKLSPKDAFWAREGSEEKDETLGNFLDKLDKLSAIEYPDDGQGKFDAGAPVLEASWYGEDGKELGRVKITREGEGKKAEFYALSTATKKPVKVSRFTGEQLETSLASVMK